MLREIMSHGGQSVSYSAKHPQLLSMTLNVLSSSSIPSLMHAFRTLAVFIVCLSGSLARGLFLICGWHVTNSWVKCPLWVNHQPGQLSPSSFWDSKWVVIHVITWITGVETIKRQIRAAYGCLVACQSLWAQAYPAAYRLCARSVCDTKAPMQLWCAACGAI